MAKSAMPTNTTGSIVYVPPVKEETILVRVEGLSPLVMHKFSEKAKKQMLDKQMSEQNAVRRRKEPKNPEEDCRGAVYFIDEKQNRFGFPASAFKKAMIAACRQVDGVTMMSAKQLFFVHATDPVSGLVEIKSPGYTMRQDGVRLESGVADLRFRPQFSEWYSEFRISFASTSINADSVVNLLNVAGRYCGIGEMRPQQNGDTYGRFEVRKVEKV